MKVLTWCWGALLLVGLTLGAPAPGISRRQDVDQIDPEKLAELKEKLENLKAVLERLAEGLEHVQGGGGLDVEVEPEEEVRRKVDESAAQVDSLESDPEVKQYMAHLAPEDQDIIKNMNSKAKYIQAVLNEKGTSDMEKKKQSEESQAELAPNDLYKVQELHSKAKLIEALKENGDLAPSVNADDERSVGDKRTMAEGEVDMNKLFEGLSDQEVATLQSQPEKWKYIQTILRKGAGDSVNADDSLGDAKQAQMKRQQEHIDTLEEQVASYKRKLQENALAHRTIHEETTEGEFGPFQKERVSRTVDDVWLDAPVPESELGMTKHERGGVDCEPCTCAPDQVNCDCDTRPNRCEKPPTEDAVKRVSARLLQDLREAQEQGVHLQDIINALNHTAKKSFGEADETELQKLATSRRKRDSLAM